MLLPLNPLGIGGIGMFAQNLEDSVDRAVALANQRRHEYATLEHLLFALTENQATIRVLQACGVNVASLRREVLNYIDNDLGDLVPTNLVALQGDGAKRTAALQRVLQRAAIHVQSSGGGQVTGANVLVAMFAERDSNAVYFLQEHGVIRFDAVNYISHGIVKAGPSGTHLAQKEAPALDETKIIAAILCARAISPENVAGDPIGKIVDLYERILAELRARDHDLTR